MKKSIFSFVAGFLLLGGFFVITPPLYAQAQSANMSISEFIELLIALNVIPSEKVNTVREIVKSYSITTQQTSVPTCTAWVNKDIVAVDETFVVSWNSSNNVSYATGKFGDKDSANGSQSISSGVPGMYVYPIKVYDKKGNTGGCEAKVLVKEKSNIIPPLPPSNTKSKNTLSVEVVGKGHIISQGNSPLISCGTLAKDCYDTYATGTAVTLTVTKGPRPQWQGCYSVSSNGYNCKVRVNRADTVVKVNFQNEQLLSNVKISTVAVTYPNGMDFGVLGGVLDQEVSVVVNHNTFGLPSLAGKKIHYVVDLYEVMANGKVTLESENVAGGELFVPQANEYSEFQVLFAGGRAFDGKNYEKKYKALIKIDTNNDIAEYNESDNTAWTNEWTITYYKG